MKDESGGGTPPDTAAETVRIVHGRPTDEEVAALVAVLASRSAEPAAPDEPPSPWRSRAPLLRRQLAPGPGSWRASGLPQ